MAHISDSFGLVIDNVIYKSERFYYRIDEVNLKAGDGTEIMGHANTDGLTLLHIRHFIQNILDFAIN
jgi:hypothetical protein